jgi:tight adherence protein C
MFENFDLQSLLQVIGSYLTIRVGEIDLDAVATSVLVLALAAALLSAFNLWRIGQSEDRQARLALHFRIAPDAAQMALRSPRWYQRLAAMVAITPLVGTVEQQKLLGALAAAGIKGEGSLANFIASKVCGAVALTALSWLFLEWRYWLAGEWTFRSAILIGALLLGWRLPDLIIRRIRARRRLSIEQGMPDALDLLVISTEAGLSLDQAIEEVGQDLRPSNPAVAEEFAITSSEMRVLSDRAEALQNLARRTELESLKSITTTLTQAIRFGTPLAESMRVLAAQMRTERLARIEERAARLPILLTIPMLVFIMPGLLIVIATAPALQIIDFLSNFTLRAAP